MLSKSRIALHIVGACLAFAGFGALATPTNATTVRATTPVCSAPRSDGNYVCITLDTASSPTTVTATLYDEPIGRGWKGEVEMNGPRPASNGELALSTEQTLSKGGSFTFAVPGVGNGQYCAVDWVWYIYTSSYQYQSEACVTAA